MREVPSKVLNRQRLEDFAAAKCYSVVVKYNSDNA